MIRIGLYAIIHPMKKVCRLGWNNPNHPQNLFKKRSGMSMQDYRHSPLATNQL